MGKICGNPEKYFPLNTLGNKNFGDKPSQNSEGIYYYFQHMFRPTFLVDPSGFWGRRTVFPVGTNVTGSEHS
jgi:hypothetical protein